MWKHKNFINLQLWAGPIPFAIYVNGEEVLIQRLSDTGESGEETWSYNASINTDKYSISGNTVVWSDGTILQRNGIDVLPTDNISGQYTTRSAAPTLTFKHFYDAGTIGTGTIKFRHYSQQAQSSGNVIKAGTYLFNETLSVASEISVDAEFKGLMNTLTANNVYGGTVTFEAMHLEEIRTGIEQLMIYGANGEFITNDWSYNYYDAEKDENVFYTATDTTKLRTIIIETDQAVGNVFYDWFVENAVKQTEGGGNN